MRKQPFLAEPISLINHRQSLERQHGIVRKIFKYSANAKVSFHFKSTNCNDFADGCRGAKMLARKRSVNGEAGVIVKCLFQVAGQHIKVKHVCSFRISPVHFLRERLALIGNDRPYFTEAGRRHNFIVEIIFQRRLGRACRYDTDKGLPPGHDKCGVKSIQAIGIGPVLVVGKLISDEQ